MTVAIPEPRRGGPPKPMRGVLHQMAFLRTDDPDLNMTRAVQVAGITGTAREAAERYRTAVLHHDDLAQQLAALFGYSRPAVWNGYVPPRTDRNRPDGVAEYNPSPYRARLVAIVTEALNRDQDWRQYDSDRLAAVPTRHIESPWTDVRGAPPPTRTEDGLWPDTPPGGA